MTEWFADILSSISYKDWRFVVGSDAPGICYLQIKFNADSQKWGGRKWRLSQYMTRSEVVQTALTAVLAAEEHEAREKFLYYGRAIYGPHLNCRLLYDLLGRDDALDVRD